jgi:chromosome segregation ATPase
MLIIPKQSPSANYSSYSIGYESDCENESRTVSIDSSLTPRELRGIARTIELDVTSHWEPDDSQEQMTLEQENKELRGTITALLKKIYSLHNEVRDKVATIRQTQQQVRILEDQNTSQAKTIAALENRDPLMKPEMSTIKQAGPVPERNYLSVDEQLRIKAAELGNSEPEAKRIYRFLSGQEDESALEHEVHILRNKVADLQYKLDTLTPSHYSFNMDNED